MVTENMIEKAYLILPHLVRCAEERRTITYQELGKMIGSHQRSMAWYLGYLRDYIVIPRGLPLINALVVNKAKGLPGSDWLPEGTDHLSNEEFLEKFEEYREKIYAYPGWRELLDELGL